MTPDNAEYMIAAYVVAGVIYLVYTWSLWRRAGRVTRSARATD